MDFGLLALFLVKEKTKESVWTLIQRSVSTSKSKYITLAQEPKKNPELLNIFPVSVEFYINFQFSKVAKIIPFVLDRKSVV